MNDSHMAMNQFYENVQKKFLPTEIAEVLFVTPMTNIYNSLRIVLRDNNIVTAETQEEQ